MEIVCKFLDASRTTNTTKNCSKLLLESISEIDRLYYGNNPDEYPSFAIIDTLLVEVTSRVRRTKVCDNS